MAENDQENGATGEQEPNSRRRFLKNILLGGAGALVAPSILTSCSVDAWEKTEHVTEEVHENKNFVGKRGVFYNTLANMAPEQASHQALEEIIYQPGYQKPEDLAAAGLTNAIAYASGFSLVPGSLTTQWPANGIHLEADLLAYQASHPSESVWLKDASGNILLDSSGNGQFINIQNPAVYQMVKAYLIDLGRRYDRGVVFDSPDMAIYHEDLHPELYGPNAPGSNGTGLVDRLGQLYEEVAYEVHQTHPTHKVKAFSGLQPATSGQIDLADKMLTHLAHGGCDLILESRTFFRSGVRTPDDYRDVVKEQIRKFAAAAASKGRHAITFDVLEPRLSDQPTTENNYGQAAVETAEFYNQVRDYIHASLPDMIVTNNIAIQDVFQGVNPVVDGLFDFSSKKAAGYNIGLHDYPGLAANNTFRMSQEQQNIRDNGVVGQWSQQSVAPLPMKSIPMQDGTQGFRDGMVYLTDAAQASYHQVLDALRIEGSEKREAVLEKQATQTGKKELREGTSSWAKSKGIGY